MDRLRKEALASRLRELAADGTAVIVATHDMEFAAGLVERVVLMGQGEVIADGPASEVLGGGWHYSTEAVRVLGPQAGSAHPRAGRGPDPPGSAGGMSWQVSAYALLLAVLGVGFAWYERRRPPARVVALVAAMAALAVVGRLAFARRFPTSSPPRTSCCSRATRSGGAGLRRGRHRRAGLQRLLRPGALDGVADGGLGGGGHGRRRARAA